MENYERHRYILIALIAFAALLLGLQLAFAATSIGNDIITGGSITTPALLLSSNATGTTTNGGIWYNGGNFLGYASGTQVRLDNNSSEYWTISFSSISSTSPLQALASPQTMVQHLFESASPDSYSNYYIFFPAPATQKTISRVRIYLASKSGSYSGDVTLTGYIYNEAGVLQHTITETSTDLEAASTGAWATLSLSGTAANKTIEGDEYVVFQIALSGATGGNFATNLRVELKVI